MIEKCLLILELRTNWVLNYTFVILQRLRDRLILTQIFFGSTQKTIDKIIQYPNLFLITM